MGIKLKLKKKLGLKAQAILDSTGKKSPLFLSKNNIGIGTQKYPKGKLHIIDESRDSNGNTLILGDTSSSNLRLGFHTNYAWIQSHGLKPLFINELGNNTIVNLEEGNLGIGTKSPTQKLEVNGSIQAKKILLSEVKSISNKDETSFLSIDTNGEIYNNNFLVLEFEKLKSRLNEVEKENKQLQKIIDERLTYGKL